MDDHELRCEIIATCLQMNATGLNQGTSGNVSVRCGDGFLITPSGVPYDRLESRDIVLMAMDGSFRVETDRKPSSEWRFHRDIMSGKSEVGAVVHAHPTYATTLAIRGMAIPAVHYMIAAAGGNTIPCAPYATYGSETLSRNVIQALNNRSACLLANHGMIATGPSLAKAMWLAVEVETLARQYFNSLLIGGPNILPDDEIDRVIEKFKSYGLNAEDDPK